MSQAGLRNFSLTKQERAVTRALTKRFGTSYFWATRLFPPAIRDATYALYAFFRIPDEYVDTQIEVAKEKLAIWRRAWEKSAKAGDALEGLSQEERLVIQATRRVFTNAAIPESYAEAFLKAMEQDLSKTQYQTYEELAAYMYGSAAVVGLMMSEVIGYKDEGTLGHARMLGEAMQLTNFLRDIGEDLRDRGRVYIPQEDLMRFGVSADMLVAGKVTPQIIELLRFEIARTRAMYVQAEKGIAELAPVGQRAVQAALVLYRAILDEIEHNAYDVFSRRARTSTLRKIQLLIPLFLRQ